MPSSPERNPMRRALSSRDYQLLAGGSAASLLGDQFSLIATPWLVLQLTHDPVALGTVLALEGIPRAALMLVGGAVSDRVSPRRAMLMANLVRLALTATMAALVFTGATRLWMIYTFALLFGVVAGFAVPAENSIVPRIVHREELQAGNSIMMGLTQLAGFVGPTVAGFVIGRFAGSLTGVGWAFAIDAGTFAVSAVTLRHIRDRSNRAEANRVEATQQESILAATRTALRYLWTDQPLRLLFTALIMINVLLMGPLLVGIPILADQRLPGGATTFGLLMSAFAIGNLLGYVAAGPLPRPSGRQLQWIICLLLTAFGLVVATLAVIPYVWVDFGLLALLGFGNGFMALILVTWMQLRTPEEMHGRMMGLMLLSSTGLVPVSQALAGVVSSGNLTALFIGPGALVLLLVCWLATRPAFGALSAELAV
ncbi:MAG: MFS transporter [Micromonosporaceae bacterium]|nr:MFS transporter [Micromonosporaceae bacterium]